MCLKKTRQLDAVQQLSLSTVCHITTQCHNKFKSPHQDLVHTEQKLAYCEGTKQYKLASYNLTGFVQFME